MDSWMSTDVADGKRLCDIQIPGSHDAGMYVECDANGKAIANPRPEIITQRYNIYDQLMQGYRMFDLRLYSNARGLMQCGHFTEKPILGGGRGKPDKHGGYGASLYTVLDNVQRFLDRPASSRETVILKFSHIHESNRSDVMDMVNSMLRNRLLDRITGLTIGAQPFRRLRGKVLAVYEKGFVGKGPFKNKVISVINPKGKKAWVKMEPKTKRQKLILRGEYANRRRLSSVKPHQENSIMKNWQKNGGKAGYPGEFLQLYWTSTFNWTNLTASRNILENTAEFWTADAVSVLKRLIFRYQPNIVITDFADEAKANAIIGWS
jgi:hypothetical protein